MYEFHPTTKSRINSGDFPLNHDCILKVEFKRGSDMKFQYFTCRSQDSGSIVDIVSKLFCVYRVKISSVDEFLL